VCIFEVADNKATVPECTNTHPSQDTTLVSCSSTTPKLMAQVEQKEHRPRKRDASFRKFRLNDGLVNRLVGWLVDSCKLFTVLSSV
jgi:hypothetical protein